LGVFYGRERGIESHVALPSNGYNNIVSMTKEQLDALRDINQFP